MIICGGKCISPLEDKNNCGACGNKCTSNERCIGGTCVCSEKEVEMIINGERRCANPKENEYCNIHINDDNEIMLITTEGIIIRLQCSDISNLGRITSGVKLINLDEGIKVATIAKVRKQPADEDGKDAEGFEEDTDKTVESED